MATDSQAEKCSSNSTKSEGNLFRCWCGNIYAPGEKFRLHFNEREQRVQAEVLAAFIASVRFGRTINNFAHLPEVVRALEWVVQDLRALQPAAKALEELLRKEREKAVAWGRLDQHKEDCKDIDCKYASAQGKIIKGCSKYLALQRQLAELEKARASLEKT